MNAGTQRPQRKSAEKVRELHAEVSRIALRCLSAVRVIFVVFALPRQTSSIPRRADGPVRRARCARSICSGALRDRERWRAARVGWV